MAVAIAACGLIILGAAAMCAAAIWMLNQARHYDDIADVRHQVQDHIHTGYDYDDDYE